MPAFNGAAFGVALFAAPGIYFRNILRAVLYGRFDRD